MTRSQNALCVLLLAIAAPAGAITADELAAKNIEARGGAAALDAIQNVRRSGRLVAGGGQRTYGVVETRRRPDSIREDLSLQGLTQVQSYDGSEGWKIDPFGGRKDPERVPADDLKGLVENASIGGPLAGYRERGDTLEYLGTEDIDGTVAHKLRLASKGGDLRYLYLDPDHFLEIRIESQRTVRGVRRTIVTDLGEYEKVEGVYWPLALTFGRKGSRDPVKVQYEKVEVNIALDPGYFSFPAGAKN